MRNINIPTVVITNMSKRWNYFQYFILGFHELESAGRIKLRIYADPFYKLSCMAGNNSLLQRVARKMNHKFNADGYNMEGYVEFDGQRHTFTIDSADAPYLFDCRKLDNMDLYFKMQCPKEIDPDLGFPLTKDIRIPYCDHEHEDECMGLTVRSPRKPCRNLKQRIGKIRPLCVGFRQLSLGNSYTALKRGYENYRRGALTQPSMRAMCYFGNALGPKPEKDVVAPDWDWERDIMGYYVGRVNHPNEKRGTIGRILQSMGDGYDGRVISENYSDSRSAIHEELVVPIEQFCGFISQFEYNINVSGYRMSIPNRFMESFIVGTAIMTDKLAVKWFHPFGKEVTESVEMGYLSDKEVDWEQFKKDLRSLPHVKRQHILKRFEEKWAPIKVAAYIVEECMKVRK